MARRRKIKPIDLSATVEELLAEYGEAVFEVVSESVEEVTKEATEKLQEVNHWANEGSGDYAGSWTNEEVPVGRLGKEMVVFNSDHYRLTHLLENGHVIRNGTKRSYGRTGKYPHIAPVNDWAVEELQKVVRQKVKNI